MEKSHFEGTLVLERLSETGHIDEFYDAVDSDNLDEARLLMKAAGIDHETIATVLMKMRDTDGED